jgi:hypothetical protein
LYYWNKNDTFAPAAAVDASVGTVEKLRMQKNYAVWSLGRLRTGSRDYVVL